MSNRNAHASSPARWRTVIACRRCRQRKVKCSGVAPCRNCTNRQQPCIFDEVDRRIVISERHLRDLERRAMTHHSRPAGSALQEDLGRDGEERHDETNRIGSRRASSVVGHHNAIEPSDSPSQTRQHPNGSGTRNENIAPIRHLSTWDFSRQLKGILQVESDDHSLSSKESYKIPLGDNKFLESVEVTLPQNQYIIHLAHVVDFHLNTAYYFFNITALINKLNSISSLTTSSISRAWNVKLLMITALGKLFLEKGATISGPPGVIEFLTVMRDFQPHDMLEDPVTAVESLCLLATYAQAADIHQMAYLYIGQASKVARAWNLDGELNTNSHDNMQSMGESHTRRLWLTVCAIDRRLSATIGASPDCTGHQPALSIILNTYPDNPELRLSLSLANTLSQGVKVLSKYRIEEAMSPSFIDEITRELVYLQSLREQIKSIQPLCSKPSLLTISRQVATLHLLFYQSIIIFTKPVLVCLMKYGLQEHELAWEQNAQLETIFKIVRTCINAANCTLSIISALYEQCLLETFMPFDMEMTFLAVLCLTIANKVLPNIVDTPFIFLAQKVLQYMSHAGSIPARLLQKELDSLSATILGCHILINESFLSNTFVDKRIVMIQDGVDLANAIFDVIEIHSPDDFLTPNAGQLAAQRQPRTALEVPTMTATTANMPELRPPVSSHEFHLDGIDPVENSFSFDMADLQWLDCVQ